MREIADARRLAVPVDLHRRLPGPYDMDRRALLVRGAPDDRRPVPADRQPARIRGGEARSGRLIGAALERLPHPDAELVPVGVREPPDPPAVRRQRPVRRAVRTVRGLPLPAGCPVPRVQLEGAGGVRDEQGTVRGVLGPVRQPDPRCTEALLPVRHRGVRAAGAAPSQSRLRRSARSRYRVGRARPCPRRGAGVGRRRGRRGGVAWVCGSSRQSWAHSAPGAGNPLARATRLWITSPYAKTHRPRRLAGGQPREVGRARRHPHRERLLRPGRIPPGPRRTPRLRDRGGRRRHRPLPPPPPVPLRPGHPLLGPPRRGPRRRPGLLRTRRRNRPRTGRRTRLRPRPRGVRRGRRLRRRRSRPRHRVRHRLHRHRRPELAPGPGALGRHRGLPRRPRRLPLPRRIPPAVRRPGRRDRLAPRPRLLQP